ncbi:hypothetical protein MHBO_003032 [Bonamia ostreae]|uniref:Protein Mpv17 n=1 Tax=Bonamia ostreae TaxID=126728 RepID=A0ABV2APA0_9EUKA
MVIKLITRILIKWSKDCLIKKGRFIRNQFDKYPIRTNLVFGGSLYILGDYISQKIENNGIDQRRIMSMAFYGFCITGPLTGWWFPFLHKISLNKFPRHQTKKLLWQIAVDQLFMDPLSLFMFLVLINRLEGRSFSLKETGRKFILTSAVDFLVMPIFQFFNFKYCPVPLQAPVASMMTLTWVVFISFIAHSNKFG